LLVTGKGAESCRQAIAAVLFGYRSEGPERVLQALGEGSKALPAEDHVSVLPAAASSGRESAASNLDWAFLERQ
jgi:hypothetical protein